MGRLRGILALVVCLCMFLATDAQPAKAGDGTEGGNSFKDE